ncbi:MAG: lamin tail domain-containing protein, partial [Sedimentisphaerales bacterium]|nr:lamin tail domain-containing protein [Sedimentisphaerales bacterium]
MLKSEGLSLLFACVVALACAGKAACPAGDINGDCCVGWDDLALLADDWLAAGPSVADLDDDGSVALRDLGILAFHWQRCGVPLVINEFMAANSSFVPDPQDEYDDWIEIHNVGDEPLDVGGMYLTDSLSDPTRWRIPGDSPVLTIVPPGGFFLLWADNDTSDTGFHAALELDAGADEIALFDTDGTSLIDSVAFAEQVGDISYGRFPDGSADWRYMVFPTPGGPNAGAYEGAVADTKFSHDRGFYDEPFDVAITCETPGAIIYYSTDGSQPYVPGSRFATGKLYMGPVRITQTTCLRAVAVRPGWMPSDVDTHTYIFLDDVITRSQSEVFARGYPSQWYGSLPADYEMDPQVYNDPDYADLMDDALLAIPTVSLVTTKNYFFDRTNNADSGGIYIYTGHSSTGGQGWERPVSVEMLTPDGDKEFQVNCGIRIQGGENRKPEKCPKHSLGLRFRSKYGPAQLEFPLFDDGPVERFDSFQFRGGFNNTWTHWARDQRERTQYIRDQWMRDALLEMGQADAGRGYFVHLYINGIYWGLYDLQERPVAAHYAAYNGGEEEDVDAINGGSPTDGTARAWQEAKSIVATRDWKRICETIDIDNFIDWTLLNLFAGNTDLKNDGNWRAAGGGPHRRPWRFYSWDGEHVMESLYQNGTQPSDDPTGMLRYLDDMEEFRVRFGDRVHRHLFNDGALTPLRNAERWRTRADEIELAVIAESARWGDYRRDMHSYSSGPYYLYTRNEFWIPQKNWLLNDYFPSRTNVALEQFRSRGLYPSVSAPRFAVNGSYRHGGPVPGGARLSMSEAGGRIWFTVDGSDPRVQGSAPEPAPENMLVPENAAKRVLVPDGPVDDAWREDANFDDSAWTSGTGGVGYERSFGYEAFFDIDVQSNMYGVNGTCYIRIAFGLSADELSALSNLTLKVRYDDGFVAYLNGSEVQRAQFSGTPTWNSSASSTHSDSDAVNFDLFNITGHRGKLRSGQNVLAVHGLNASTASSDFLISVELISSATPGGGVETGVSPTATEYVGPVVLNKSAHVNARALSGGTWSALNEAIFAVGPVAESLRISEMMYHPGDTGSPDDPNTEYVELTNVGGETIDLNLVKFTNGI